MLDTSKSLNGFPFPFQLKFSFLLQENGRPGFRLAPKTASSPELKEPSDAQIVPSSRVATGGLGALRGVGAAQRRFARLARGEATFLASGNRRRRRQPGGLRVYGRTGKYGGRVFSFSFFLFFSPRCPVCFLLLFVCFFLVKGLAKRYGRTGKYGGRPPEVKHMGATIQIWVPCKKNTGKRLSRLVKVGKGKPEGKTAFWGFL